ncbi:unnamed protein product [Leptosia nina]|uniref:Uncharacterized protein n=1 Tax=Leptosia nina TaxID=320188 RepID=A0AAV1K3P7_9NEOP
MKARNEKIEKPITPDFVNYRNKLVEKYKQRQQEPSSWSGLGAAHAQFAEHAAKVLEECRYKHAARNVIDVS